MNGNIFIDAQEVANELGTSKAYAYKPVSYTHLDVYKRQMVIIAYF